MATQKTSFWLAPKGLAALGLIGAATYFLLIEHRQHVWQFLPFLILLACPFMHFFMHRGHGVNRGHGGHSASHQHEGESDQDAYQRGLEDGRRDSEHRHHH
ncbi:DUF2933 domain-containing protein [Kangiella aquimarina]|uniref:DUF2933 domain-containing protein n=1 Tax=Kangiella aquimarina TaxID=261965 RepID=A0ABZ0X1J6_9GAMM|nr:DUF2933 domain-containing protein [Kangiella aquimarina]WQG84458.1 DUF2933 domain-containing protein [Kangiella aquimarina]